MFWGLDPYVRVAEKMLRHLPGGVLELNEGTQRQRLKEI